MWLGSEARVMEDREGLHHKEGKSCRITFKNVILKWLSGKTHNDDEDTET